MNQRTNEGGESPEPLGLRFSRAFLRHRHLAIAAFAIATVVAVLCIPLVRVNYSMTDYLPQDSASTRALDEMDASFDSGIPNVRLYAEGIDLAQARQLADALGDVDGVTDVMWLGTQVDVDKPLEVQDAGLVGDWKTDDGYLFQFVGDEADGAAVTDAARRAAEDAGAAVSMSGDLVDNVNMQASTSAEIGLIMAAAVAIVIVILLLTSHSWFEPVVFLIPIGVAIVLNMGTNLVLGEISFVSQLCGAVLQLAVSMDYAIVFLHRFRGMQHEFDDNVEAMAHCMQRSFSIELSSAGVTFFGFLALTVMRFGIGANLGIVLAKGIVFSFVSVIFLMPCLLLAMLPLLDRFEHRYLVPSLAPVARLCERIAVPAAVVIALIAVPAYLGEDRTGFFYGTGEIGAADTSVAQEKQRIADSFGSAETWVLMVPEGQWAHEQALVNSLEATEHIDGVTSYVTVAGNAMPVDMVPEAQREQVISNGWSRIVITTDIEDEGDAAFDLVETVRDEAAQEYGDAYLLAGNSVSLYDLRDVSHADAGPVKLFTIGAIAIVLAIMFRSISIPILVVLAIEVSIWMNLAVPYFTGTSLSYIGYLVIDSVQMGAAVDYAIVLTRSYFDERRHKGPKAAAREAIAYAGVPILTSALILSLAGFAIQGISTTQIVAQLGSLVFRGALLSAAMMFLFLPFLFRLCDRLIQRTSLGLTAYEGPEPDEDAGDAAPTTRDQTASDTNPTTR